MDQKGNCLMLLWFEIKWLPEAQQGEALSGGKALTE